MTRFFVALIGLVMAWTSVHAQTPTQESDVDKVALNERGRALKAERDALEKSYKAQLKQCYQEFNVTSCRNEAREKYVVSNRALQKRENEQSTQERHVQAQEARQRLADRQAEAADRAREAERAQQSSIERAARNAEKQADHVPEASKRSQFEEKQADAQQRREEVARRAREREKDKPRAAPLPPVGGKP